MKEELLDILKGTAESAISEVSLTLKVIRLIGYTLIGVVALSVIIGITAMFL